MGVILSCCRDTDSEENEALLRSQQNGYGVTDNNEEDDIVLQRQIQEREQKVLERNQELKEIVENLNDKLIDISMISNSGIVLQGNDLEDINAENNEDFALPQSDLDNDEADTTKVKQKKSSKDFAVLNSNTNMSKETKDKLKKVYKIIFEDLEDQLKVKVPGELTISLK